MKRLPRAACSRLENLTLCSDIRTHEKERERGERIVLGNDFERKRGGKEKLEEG